MADADQGESTRRPWLIAVALAVAVVVIGLLLWFVPFGTSIIAGANRNNQRDLAIAASGLEHWSRAIPDVARSSFIRGRVQTITDNERDYRDGWRYKAAQYHPNLGSYRILYTVTTRPGCIKLKDETAAREGRLPFVGSYTTGTGAQLKLIDSFPLDEVRTVDLRTGDAAVGADVGAYVADITGETPRRIARAGPDEADRTVVCFAIVIPIERLLVIDQAATRFSNFLIVDSRRQIVTQIGALPLPVASLDGLVPETSALVNTLAASLSQKGNVETRQEKFGESLEPVDLRIQGRSYIGYIQPFFPPANFDACQPEPPKPADDAKPSTKDATAAAATASGQCFVVALMPKALVFRQIASPPLAILVAVGLALGMAIALLPSLRLILLGQADAIGRIELVCVVLGIPAAASLATLAMLFSTDLVMHRNAAQATALAIARDSATRAADEYRAFVVQAIKLSTLAEADLAAHRDPLGAAGPRLADRCPDKPVGAAGVALDTNPRPLNCAGDIDLCPSFIDAAGLPKVESLTLYNELGGQLSGTRVIACRQLAGGRANVRSRDYFARLRYPLASRTDGQLPDGRPYVAAQVLGVQDGINKSVVAFRLGAPGATDQPFVVAGGVLPSLASPVLPQPMAMMVIDVRDDTMPVIIHPQPNHSGAERLQAAGNGDSALSRLLRPLSAREKDAVASAEPIVTVSLRHDYDGVEQAFAAAPIAGTSFVVLVHYAVSDIDAQPALTASLAIRTWAAFSILCGGIWLLWLAATGDRYWPRLWPQERHRARYRALTLAMTTMAIVAIVVVAGIAGVGQYGVLALVIGLAVRVAAAVMLHGWRIRAAADTNGRFLAPVTQRAYSWMLIALVACLSVVPMAGFWIDARDASTAKFRRAALSAIVAPGGAIETNDQTIDGIRRAFGMRDRFDDHPGQFGVDLRSRKDSVEVKGPFAVAQTLSGLRSAKGDSLTPRECSGEPAAAPKITVCRSAAHRLTDAIDETDAVHVPDAWRFDNAPTLLQALVLIAFGGALVALLVYVGRRVLRALTGFGIAVDAVDLPELCLTDLWGVPAPPGFATLNRKSLLVNAPFVMLDMLRRGGDGSAWARTIVVNVGEAGARPLQLADDSIVLVTGLDLVIADTERRKAALALIERMIAYVEALPHHTKARLVILSTTAPLERILDAYERDASRSSADTSRENLRWARVFEDFAAYYFRPIEVTDGRPAAWQKVGVRARSPDARAAVNTVLRELRWVPPHVVNGVIGAEITVDDATLDAACVPIPSAVYLDLYRRPLIRWAVSRRFVGEAAAISYLRSQMIEFYQRCWSSSTHAERLILHNMAFGRLVNLTTAIAFISLVRRGLVVLDPEPRLMNDSFAMFVRQAEKLDTIADWQSELPSGAWVKARLPIVATLGMLAAAAVVFAVWSGQQLTALIPLLAAGAPALVATLSRLVRSN